MEGPSNPEDAMKYQEALENGKYIPKVYTVYESDGKTIIDTFTETIPDQYLNKFEFKADFVGFSKEPYKVGFFCINR